jgi:anti-anti-sigma factor
MVDILDPGSDATNARRFPALDDIPVVLGTRLLRCGRTLWLELHGVLNWRTTELFWQHFRAGLARPCRRVVVDLTGIAYVGGDGLRALMILQEQLVARGVELRLVVPEGSRCARTIALAKLHNVLPTFSQPSRAWRHRCRTPRPVSSVSRHDGLMPAISLH